MHLGPKQWICCSKRMWKFWQVWFCLHPSDVAIMQMAYSRVFHIKRILEDNRSTTQELIGSTSMSTFKSRHMTKAPAQSILFHSTSSFSKHMSLCPLVCKSIWAKIPLSAFAMQTSVCAEGKFHDLLVNIYISIKSTSWSVYFPRTLAVPTVRCPIPSNILCVKVDWGTTVLCQGGISLQCFFTAHFTADDI